MKDILTVVNTEWQVNICEHHLWMYMQKGLVGILPLRKGPRGNIPPMQHKNLCRAVETYICINQINGNGRKNTPSSIGLLLQKVIYGDPPGTENRAEIFLSVFWIIYQSTLIPSRAILRKIDAFDGPPTKILPSGLTIGKVI
jgi:hypothetical protein